MQVRKHMNPLMHATRCCTQTKHANNTVLHTAGSYNQLLVKFRDKKGMRMRRERGCYGKQSESYRVEKERGRLVTLHVFAWM